MRCKELTRLIEEDNVDELAKILNSNVNQNFNNLQSSGNSKVSLLHFAVYENSQRVVEYLLSQDFVDKSICNPRGENIYHVICYIRGAEELFSIIERKVPHHLLLNNSYVGINAFHIACKENNVFIVKRLYEILESLQLDLTPITKYAINWVIRNKDIEVIKYVLSIRGIQLNDDILLESIKREKFDIVVYLLNIYLCQSIPSHLLNQFHIFQFSSLHSNSHINNNKNNFNNLNMDDKNNNFQEVIEENYQKLINIKGSGNRIWHEVCENANLDVVQLIFSLKGIQAEILNKDG